MIFLEDDVPKKKGRSPLWPFRAPSDIEEYFDTLYAQTPPKEREAKGWRARVLVRMVRFARGAALEIEALGIWADLQAYARTQGITSVQALVRLAAQALKDAHPNRRK